MNNKTRYLLIALLILLLFLVRAAAQRYFYDPLILFFKQDHLNAVPGIPNQGRFYLFLAIRYWINAAISIGIIHLLFPRFASIKFLIKIFIGAFLLLGLGFIILLQTSTSGNYRALFYVRRFLIHPVLLLLLIPAFYHRKLQEH